MIFNIIDLKLNIKYIIYSKYLEIRAIPTGFIIQSIMLNFILVFLSNRNILIVPFNNSDKYIDSRYAFI